MKINIDKIINFIKYGHPNCTDIPNAYTDGDTIKSTLNFTDEEAVKYAKLLIYHVYNQDILFKDKELQKNFFMNFIMDIYYNPNKLPEYYNDDSFRDNTYILNFIKDSKVWLINFNTRYSEIKDKLELPEILGDNVIETPIESFNAIKPKLDLEIQIVPPSDPSLPPIVNPPSEPQEETLPIPIEALKESSSFVSYHPGDAGPIQSSSFETSLLSTRSGGILYASPNSIRRALNDISNNTLSAYYGGSLEKDITIIGPTITDPDFECNLRLHLIGNMDIKLKNWKFKKPDNLSTPETTAITISNTAKITKQTNVTFEGWEELYKSEN